MQIRGEVYNTYFLTRNDWEMTAYVRLQKTMMS